MVSRQTFFSVLKTIQSRSSSSPFHACRAYTVPVASLPSGSHRLGHDTPFIRAIKSSPQAHQGPGDIGQDDFLLYPDFFSKERSRILIAMALWKLDRVDSTRKRRRRKNIGIEKVAEEDDASNGSRMVDNQDLFEEPYGFEEGHYDSVITQYRETLLSSFPTDSSLSPAIPSLMQRIYSLLPLNGSSNPALPGRTTASAPPPLTSTHLLHLAPNGKILPHVDNLDASGSVIIGVSLGAERILRLVKKGSKKEGSEGIGWDIKLPNGSLYIQRDSIRYQYEHSVLAYDDPSSQWDNKPLRAGHRISIMVRDAPRRNVQL